MSSSPSSVPVSRLPVQILPTSDSRAAQLPALNPFASLNSVTVPGTRCLSPPCIPVCGLLCAAAKISWPLHEEVTHLSQAHVSDSECSISPTVVLCFAWPGNQLGHPPFVQCLSTPRLLISFLSGHPRPSPSYQHDTPQGARGIIHDCAHNSPAASILSRAKATHSQDLCAARQRWGDLWACSQRLSDLRKRPPFHTARQALARSLSLAEPPLRTPVVLFHLNLTFDPRGLPSAPLSQALPAYRKLPIFSISLLLA